MIFSDNNFSFALHVEGIMELSCQMEKEFFSPCDDLWQRISIDAELAFYAKENCEGSCVCGGLVGYVACAEMGIRLCGFSERKNLKHFFQSV